VSLRFDEVRRHESSRWRHLIDAPFDFRTWSMKGQGRSPSQHYRTMSLDAIKALPIAKMAAPDCFLFAWIPLPLTPHLVPIMTAWGFTFSGTAFVWAKRTPRDTTWAMGGGYGTRKNAEICWLGRRGNPKRRSRDVRELMVAPRREHSRKPDEQYGRIEPLCAGPYLELFARQQRPGWIALGDEVNKFQFPLQRDEPRRAAVSTFTVERVTK
jgi:N6-adenosine-specific RNA methylase IME4